MDKIVKFVLEHFGISENDLKPSLNPKPTNYKARIILAKFLKEQDFSNFEIIKVLQTNDVSSIYCLINIYKVNKFPELVDLHSVLKEKFEHIKGNGTVFKAYKKCVKCREKKLNYKYFRKVKKGKYYHICLACEEINRLKAINPVVSIKKDKNAVEIPLSKPAKKVLLKKEPKPKKEKVKTVKTKAIKYKKATKKLKVDKVTNTTESKINTTYGAKKHQISTAIQALQIAKEREKELLNNGAKYVKNGLRAYVLKKQ